MKHSFVRIVFPARHESTVAQVLERRGAVDYALERRGINHRVADDAFEFEVPPDAPVVLTLEEPAGLVLFDVLRDMPGLQSVTLERGTWDDGMAEEEYRAQHAPIQVDPQLQLRPHWLPLPEKSYGLVVRTEPGGLFGSAGEHSTTQACLQLTLQVMKPGARVLDLGSGSGILAVTSVLLGAHHATCVELEELATKETERLAQLNGVPPDRLSVIVGDVLKVPLNVAQYDVLFFNIGPRITREFFGAVGTQLRPDSHVILSGITVWSQQTVLDVFAALGRTPKASICLDDEWVTFLL